MAKLSPQAGLSIKLFGAKLNNATRAAAEAGYRAAIAGAGEIANAMKDAAPRKTGKLADSIRLDANPSNRSVRILAGGAMTRTPQGTDYAEHQEYGTSKMPANPFYWPTWRKMKARVKARMYNAMDDAMKREFNKWSGLELQRTIVARLKADATLNGIVAGRIYDVPPANPVFPYVTLGEDQSIPDRGDGYEGLDVTTMIHAWSKAQGYPEAKRMVDAIYWSLTDAPLALTGFRLISLGIEDSRVLRDTDPAISHGVLAFLARTEPV